MDLTAQANKLDKAFKIAKKHDEDRSQHIKNDCDRLREGSKKLRALMALLQSKADQCESIMGIYSGK